MMGDRPGVVGALRVCLSQVNAVFQVSLEIGHKKAPTQVALHMPGNVSFGRVGHIFLSKFKQGGQVICLGDFNRDQNFFGGPFSLIAKGKF